MSQAQLFAWEAYDKGSEVHLQASPTKLELLYRSFKVKKETFQEQERESILEKYGGQEHMASPLGELLLAQTEDYVECAHAYPGILLGGRPMGIQMWSLCFQVFRLYCRS